MPQIHLQITLTQQMECLSLSVKEISPQLSYSCPEGLIIKESNVILGWGLVPLISEHRIFIPRNNSKEAKRQIKGLHEYNYGNKQSCTKQVENYVNAIRRFAEARGWETTHTWKGELITVHTITLSSQDPT